MLTPAEIGLSEYFACATVEYFDFSANCLYTQAGQGIGGKSLV